MKNYFTDILSQIESYFHFKKIKRFRLFNKDGIELEQDDLEYIKENAIVYASAGKIVVSEQVLTII